MTDWCRGDGPNILLVEGTNDCHVVLALCQANKLPENAFVINACESDNQVLEKLNALITGAQPKDIIGVVLDADEKGVATRWQSINSKVARHGYVLPDNPSETGTVVEGPSRKPRLGFWFMPDNQRYGMLEDFCLKLADPGVVQVAEDCVNNAKAHGVASFKDVHHSKAVVHTLLAWQDEPGKPLGQSITAKVLRPNHDLAMCFTDWLRALFR